MPIIKKHINEKGSGVISRNQLNKPKMIAKLQNPGDLNNSNLRVAHKLEKTEFQKFYQGFPCYSSFELDNDGITYFLQSPDLADYWKLAASKFIDENSLDLEVIGTGKISTTFIIKRK